MTARTVGTQIVLVIVLMAGQAVPLQPEPAPFAVFPLDQGGNATCLKLGGVTCPAGRRGVLAFERPTGSGVIESYTARLTPVDQVEFDPCVLRMASGTVAPGLGSVKPELVRTLERDLPVTGRALVVERVVSAAMAVETAACSFEGRVGPGQRAG
ncbi:MAG: hypothetical protein GY722_13330 [bacterium]|nr:hypothetical protein [bacterium]